jgi:hypothetical protein
MSQHDPDAMDDRDAVERPLGEDDPLAVPTRETEMDLARAIPDDQMRAPSEELSTSDLDTALRLKDGVTTWGNEEQAAAEVGSPDPGGQMGPEPEPYVPLVANGDQGI